MTKANYTRRFEDLSRKQFDEAYAWLGHLGKSKPSDGYHFVSFDEYARYGDEEHVRVDSTKRTIELTDRLDHDFGHLLEHIIEAQKEKGGTGTGDSPVLA